MARDVEGEKWTLHGDKQLTHLEAELGVERQGPTVVRRLKQAQSGTMALSSPLDPSFHELATNCTVLDCGIDRDRAYPNNRRSFIQDIAANDAAIHLGDDHVVPRVRQLGGESGHGDVGRRNIWREVMVLRDHPEGLVADRSTPSGVVWLANS
jgi:hypothetical protein